MSAPSGAWKRNSLRLIADVPRAHGRAYLPDCPADCERVAVLMPPERIPEAPRLVSSKFGRTVGVGDVRVRVEGELVRARRVDPSEAHVVAETKAHWVVHMQREVET